MKKSFLFTLVCLISFSVAAQENEPKEGYQFEVIKELPVTSVKDQNSTGTCWCFSALSFLESEIIRNGYRVRSTFLRCSLFQEHILTKLRNMLD